MRHRRLGRYAAAVSVLALLSTLISCESPGNGGGCWGTSCPQSCTQDEECPAGEHCTPVGSRSDRWECRPGCKADSECAPLFCTDGQCEAGCRTHDDCSAGQACSFFTKVDLIGDRLGECIAGCRVDAECGSGEHCVCHSCSALSCDSNDDCGPDAYCARGLLDACNLRCRPLPPPVNCGAALCRSTSVLALVQEVGVPACCPANTDSECGLYVDGLLRLSGLCQPLDQPGIVDPSCGPDSTFPGGPLVACRRPDGTCGHLVSALGLGCVAGL